MDERRVAAIRERAEKAAKGPWHTQYQTDNDGFCLTAEVFGGEKGHFLFGIETDTDDALENAAFVAHAREDVPWLLAALAAREGELAEMRDFLTAEVERSHSAELARVRAALAASEREVEELKAPFEPLATLGWWQRTAWALQEEREEARAALARRELEVATLRTIIGQEEATLSRAMAEASDRGLRAVVASVARDLSAFAAPPPGDGGETGATE